MSTSGEYSSSSIHSAGSSVHYEIDPILNSISKLLKNRIFIGCYTERRLIEIGTLSTYKDVIVVDKSEIEFMKILTSVNDLLNNHFRGRIISCISGANSGYCLWTNLTGVAFGPHWFIVKHITLHGNIMNIGVKWLRPIDPDQKPCSSSGLSFDWEGFNIDTNAMKNIARNVSQVVTVENLMSSFRFLLVLFLTLLVGSYRMLLLLLKWFHELNYFVQTMTPIVLACIDSITKAFGGFLILIAMMWNNKSNSKKLPNGPPALQYRQQSVYPENSRMTRDMNYYQQPYSMYNRTAFSKEAHLSMKTDMAK